MVGVLLHDPDKENDKEQLVASQSNDVLVTVVPLKGDPDETIAPIITDVRRKQTSTLFSCLSALLMVGCLVIGVWLLFDFINRRDNIKTWRKTCRFRIKAVDNDGDGRVYFDHEGLTAFDDGKNQILPSTTTVARAREFQQEVNIDLKKNLETIEVPQIGFTSKIRIIQDFEHNITAIRDFGVNKCFIMPLDREHVPNPNNLMEALVAMMSGQFLPDNEVLRRTMKVQTPAMTESEVSAYGPIVSGTCSNEIKTFRLVAKTVDEIQNRRRRSADALTYVYSVGRHAILYDIDH